MKNKYIYQRLIDIIFGITLMTLGLIMIVHFQIAKPADDHIATACLWGFTLYFLWYDRFSKNKKLTIIPIWLYLIIYDIINWDEICEIWNNIMG